MREIISVSDDIKREIANLLGDSSIVSRLSGFSSNYDKSIMNKGVVSVDGYLFMYEINDHIEPVFSGPYTKEEIIGLIADEYDIPIPGYEMDLITVLELSNRVVHGEAAMFDAVEKKLECPTKNGASFNRKMGWASSNLGGKLW